MTQDKPVMRTRVKPAAWILAGGCFLVVFIVTLLLRSCLGGTALTLEGNAVTSTLNKGYYAPGNGEYISAGGENQDIQITKVEATGNDQKTRLTFTLVEGVNEVDLSDTPYFEVASFAGPSRLVLWFEHIQKFDELKVVDAGLVTDGASFVSYSQVGRVGYFINLTGPCAYRIERRGNDIIVELVPEGERQAGWVVSWYAIARLHQQVGTALQNYDMWPALCTDRAHMLLCSKVYASQTEAQAKMDELQAALGEDASNYYMEVCQLTQDGGVTYNAVGDTSAVLDRQLVRIDNAPAILPLQNANGRLIAVGPDGTLAYAACEETDAGDFLYIAKPGQTPQLLITDMFANIRSASFSPDGLRLCLIDNWSEEDSRIFVIDLTTANYDNLSEMGMGSVDPNVGNAIWRQDGRAIIAISGTDQMAGGTGYQLHEAVLTDTSWNVNQTLDERRATMGHIAYGADGGYYFTQESDDTQKENGYDLYALRNGVRAKLAAADNGIAASPDGKFIAYASLDINGEAVTYSLWLYDVINNSHEKVLQSDTPIAKPSFAPDANTLYWIVESPDDVDFPLQVWRTSAEDHTQSTHLFDLASERQMEISASNGGQLFIYVKTWASGVCSNTSYVWAAE